MASRNYRTAKKTSEGLSWKRLLLADHGNRVHMYFWSDCSRYVAVSAATALLGKADDRFTFWPGRSCFLIPSFSVCVSIQLGQ